MRNLIKEGASDELFGNRVERIRFVLDDDIKNKIVLDIGCGFGWCEKNFLERGVRKIIAFDLSDDAKEAIEGLGSDRLTFVQGSTLRLPFEDNSFDTVVTWEVIEHVPKHHEVVMLKEIKRVLKPGGNLYLSTQHNNLFSTLLDPAWWLIGHRHYSIKQLITEINF